MRNVIIKSLHGAILGMVFSATAIGSETSEAIAVVNAQFEAGFASANAELITDVYTVDGQLLPPNSRSIAGLENIHQFWQGAIDMGIKKAELETTELDEQGNTAIELGTYKLLAEKGEMIDQGKYIVIWKKTEQGWKYHRDMWSSELAPK